ncbi:hypothetical protein JL107_17685 [Nakamurella flavida]|uniref:Uncharacterized protein n=1 Tax=Nakamurella flavida TaxID=363630 RepID=A0A938YS96_9ACTN|nr:hypothetical protein [Nakamurella flavida]
MAGRPGPPLLVIGELTRQVGDWPNTEAAVDLKEALASGRLIFTAAPDDGSPSSQEIRLGGLARRVQLQSARAAVDAMIAGGTGSCPECPPLRLTAPAPTTLQVSTLVGSSVLPAWDFPVAGTDVHLIRVAVDPGEYLTVEGLEYGPVGGDTTAELLSPRRLRVTFTGSQPATVGPCGRDYAGGAEEDGRVFVVRIAALPNPAPAPADLACGLVAAMRTVEIELTEPLGDRVIITEGVGFAVPRV